MPTLSGAFVLPVDQWDTILIFVIVSRLDIETKKQWDISLKDNVLPSFQELEIFLEKHCYALSNSNKIKIQTKCQRVSNVHVSGESEPFKINCHICDKSHKTFKCRKCQGQHNQLLHFEETQPETVTNETTISHALTEFLKKIYVKI